MMLYVAAEAIYLYATRNDPWPRYSCHDAQMIGYFDNGAFAYAATQDSNL